MGDIVEHVANSILDCGEGDISPLAYVDPHKAARAAIRATLEYLRENVSEKMEDAGIAVQRNVLFDDPEADPCSIFGAMLSAALNDIERTG